MRLTGTQRWLPVKRTAKKLQSNEKIADRRSQIADLKYHIADLKSHIADPPWLIATSIFSEIVFKHGGPRDYVDFSTNAFNPSVNN